MFKRIISIFSNAKDANSKQPYDGVVSNEYYEIVTRHIAGSKYCSISNDEEKFIKNLLLKLHQNNLKPVILERMSTKTISVSFYNYPIGKIKLQGTKTWMQILSIHDQDKIENASLEEYIESIDLWIAHIKKINK